MSDLLSMSEQVVNDLLVPQQLASKSDSKFEDLVSKLYDLLTKWKAEDAELAKLASKSQQVIGFRLQLADEPSKSAASQQQVKGGLARAAKLTPERRREIAMLGVAARRAKAGSK